MKIYSAESMRRIDKSVMKSLSIPSTLLMENAARSVFEAIILEFPQGLNITAAVFCGGGNNGGDGIAVARLLMSHGADVRCFLTAKREKMGEDALNMERRLNEFGGKLEQWDVSCQDYVKSADLIVDAIYGTGLNREVDETVKPIIELINKCHAQVVAIDIASGVESDTGHVLGTAVYCDLTVTFTAPKAGHFLPQGGLICGKLKVVDIGIPQSVVKSEPHIAEIITEDMVKLIIPQRREDAHKGDFGRLLLLCASEGYTGAGTLAARAALRSGAGLVTLAVPRSVYQISAISNVEAMVVPLDSFDDGKLSIDALPEILRRLDSCDACLIGPGLGRSEALDKIVEAVILNSKVPLVIDADGINALSMNIDILHKAACPIVLTPHPGEFSRIYDGETRDKMQAAKCFAAKYGATLVLKGYRTIVAAENETYINVTGNVGMATGGSGDMLAGMIVSLIGQGVEPSKAAVAAVRLHGAAGDLCAENIGKFGMLPSDMIEVLPHLLP